MEPDPQHFPEQVDHALADKVLRGNLKHVTGIIRQRRNTAFNALHDGESLRSVGQALKQEALLRLPELLEQMEAKLNGRGIVVHWAETVEEAQQILLKIARQHNVKQAVKGKSMVSEELDLNHFFARHNIEAIESDLGEFIVQLADEPPSHILAPAIHMNRQQIGTLFKEKLGVDYTVDVQEMTALARKVLREKFQTAEMGITGVNFAVAETGTVALVENEGNGRMTTTTPSVHVALMGLEKVIPRLSSLGPLMRLLTLSGTGQKISTYFNLLSSPRRANEKDGPDAVHLLILDNGRSGIYGDAELRETLQCIRCGACLNACPIYARLGGHTYESVYMGPIGKILTPQMAGLEKGGHLAEASTLCGACQEVCPVKIPIPNLLLRLRQEAKQPTPAGSILLQGTGMKKHPGETMIWKGWQVLHEKKTAYRMMGKLAYLASKVVPQEKGPLKAWSRFRILPKPQKKSLHSLLKKRPNR